MPERIFPNDVPFRESYGRKGKIATRLDNANYYLDWGRGEAELAYWSGGTPLEPQVWVYAVWAHDVGVWWIEGEVVP